ncbi:Uncharacterised protein [Mycobacteroides abscessus subsp. abscessus]|uniref:hypothetical protein n=1 Tax=Mycobacteroides abscessus TaxID=36809 RepID=UPI000925F126|nr:hypothetical protein [Mycobacteroides abscessus]SIA41865.1 Uncharacterised protein [Mycobacteroides abscessus subsp. abscessus]SIA57169.1 Uncharacterised protein [Mycobacteroides abscessus subsp. abscessus]
MPSEDPDIDSSDEAQDGPPQLSVPLSAPKLTMPTPIRARRNPNFPVDETEPSPAGDSVAPAAATPPPSPGDAATSAVNDSDDDSPADQMSADELGTPGEIVPEAATRAPDPMVLKVIGAIIIACIVIASAVWIATSPDTPDVKATETSAAAPSSSRTWRPPPPSAPIPTPAGDTPIPNLDYSTDGCPGAYDAKLAASQNPREAFVCLTQGVLFGQTLIITFPARHVVSQICFWPGFNGRGVDGKDEWYWHRLLKTVQFVFREKDGTPIEGMDPVGGYPNGERQNYCLHINNVQAWSIKMTVLETQSPPPPPPPTATPTPGETDIPDFQSLLPEPTFTPGSAEDPSASSIAMWGFVVEGHVPQ